MVSEETCPATGRVCRNSGCERGGCRKMRITSAKPVEPKPAVAVERRVDLTGADVPAELASLREALAEALKARNDLEAVLSEAVAALEHGDAALSLLQSSLGVKSSPRLDELRRVKAKLRAVLKTLPGDAAPPAAA
jgi:hypothetical protein